MGAFATGFKYTAIGCLGLILLLALGIGVLGFFAVKDADAAIIEEETRSWKPEPALVRDADAEALGGALGELAAAPTPGVIVIDLSSGAFEIEPAAPGEGLSIDASYRKGNYELIEAFTESDGAEPWRYEVTFRQSRSTLLTAVQAMIGKNRPELTVRVPPDLPYRLELRVDSAGLSADLGGLWLTELDVKLVRGGGAFSFGEPLREPLRSMSVDSRMGGLAIGGVGNAAPRELYLSSRMSGMAVDLDGEWPHDTMISIRARSGEVALQMPDNARVEGVPETLYRSSIPDNPEIPAPVLRFSSDSTFDNVEFN